MAFGDADLPAFFADFGTAAVIFGGVTVKGIFDRPIQIKLAGEGFGGVQAAFPEVRIPYNAFGDMPMEDDTVMVNGAAYTVSEFTAEGDGAIVCLTLKVFTL